FTLLHEDRTAGLSRIAARLCSDPPKYLAWYLAKPWLLWQWDIRMGEGDIFVYKARSSAYGWSAPYRATAAIAHALNPWLFALAIRGRLLPRVRHRDLLGVPVGAPVLGTVPFAGDAGGGRLAGEPVQVAAQQDCQRRLATGHGSHAAMTTPAIVLVTSSFPISGDGSEAAG